MPGKPMSSMEASHCLPRLRLGLMKGSCLHGSAAFSKC